MRLTLLALFLAGAAMPATVAAQTYRFDVVDPDSTLGGQPFQPYYFFLPKSPVPVSPEVTSFTLSGTTYGATYSSVAIMDHYTFYSDMFGGFDDDENIYFGPQLFTGTTDAPTFRLGTFDLDNFGSGATLTISAVGAVPEPSSWALMIAGFGGVGWAMRRRARVRVSFG